MSSMKVDHFVPMSKQTWPPHAILVSDWSISKKSSPLKLLSHMNRNLVGSIYMYGRFKFPQSRMKGERHSFYISVYCKKYLYLKDAKNISSDPAVLNKTF